MRKLTFIMIMLFCASFTYAQKGKVSQASSYLSSGKLDEAKKLIDEAIAHENCVNDSKSWLVKGQIYQGIFESPLPDYKKLDPNALDVAYEAYQKAIELDDKGKVGKKLKTQYNNLIIDFTNKAVEYYNSENFKGALEAFKKVLEIEKSPVVNSTAIDTIVIFNAGISAHRAEEFAEAEKYYKEVLKYNYEPARTYAMLANVLKAQGKEEEAVQYLHKGYELYPNDANMLVELINYYLLGGEPEKAEQYLDAAIQQDPNNASFYRAKGSLYEKMNEPAKAVEMYEKALSIDPKDFASQYNLGTAKLNEVIKFHEKVNDIVDADEYNKSMEQVYKGYESVIPYFEKAHEIDPKEPNTMETLKALYFKLRTINQDYMQKYENIKAMLDGENK